MVTYESLLAGADKLSLVGLGYVGLPIAVAFSKKLPVIGYDLNSEKIGQYRAGVDPTGEVGEGLQESRVAFTDDPELLRQARFHIVAVPTPVREDKTPDLAPLEGACVALGGRLLPGSVVVFESTVYPGVTEEVCVPILERESGLVCGEGFKVGYSPERINPGDKVHRLETITKVVSGMDAETLELIARVYELVVEAGVYRAASIKVAEAAKVIENSQRDINIAFMNELAIIFHRLGIDTREVLAAAGTKWNFLNFTPGLVGGHCIGVDPYYLTYRAEQTGYHSRIILAGRRINDDMGRYVAESAVKLLVKSGRDVSRARVGILGFTFKENCPDTRNTKVIDIVNELQEYGLEPMVADPVADAKETREHYGMELVSVDEVHNVDCLIVAVGHREFADLHVRQHLVPGGLLMDVKGVLDADAVQTKGCAYWRL